MPSITEEGYYRGVIIDHGVNTTRVQGLPQFVVTVMATAQHNAADDTWDGTYQEYQLTLSGYFVLVSKNKQDEIVKCLSYEQIMEATGWDGETYAGLAAMDLRGTEVQIQAQNETFEGKTTLRMKWISAVGASIGLSKITGQDLTDLDAAFGGMATPKKKTPAKPKPRATKKASPAPKPSVMEPPAKSKPSVPKPPVAESPAPIPSEVVEEQPDADLTPCTDWEAYEACKKANEACDNPVPEENLLDYWASNTLKYAANPDAVKDTEWPAIRNATLMDINIPF